MALLHEQYKYFNCDSWKLCFVENIKFHEIGGEAIGQVLHTE